MKRQTESEGSAASFSLAVNEFRAGEETTLWVNCSCYGMTAESVVNHLKKGSMALVEGRLQVNEKDGKTYVNLICTNVRFVFNTPVKSSDNVTPEHKEETDLNLLDNIPF